MRPRRERLGCPLERVLAVPSERPSMRPRRERLGCPCVISGIDVASSPFNEAEARTPRMPPDSMPKPSRDRSFNEAEARTPRMPLYDRVDVIGDSSALQ